MAMYKTLKGAVGDDEAVDGNWLEIPQPFIKQLSLYARHLRH